MSLTKIESYLTDKLSDMQANGRLKGKETVVTGIRPAENGNGPRYYLQGQANKAFLRMNSNSYLGLELDQKVIQTEADTAEIFGCGPGAVRFISGTYKPHIELEQKLAEFHHRESAMIFSAAYAAIMGVLPQLISDETLVVSDALNHNSIINAIRLSRPAAKAVYAHVDMTELEEVLVAHQGKVKRVCVVSDGIFSMRGDHAPLAEICACCQRHEQAYEQGIITIVDDSHGVGAFGKTGRGTEEFTQAQADILIATLGKAIGVNGGYAVSSQRVIDYLRETAPFYIYSNPITVAEAAAATTSLEIIDSSRGLHLLEHVRMLADRLKKGLIKSGFETLKGDHPIVPVLLRDSAKTSAWVKHLFAKNILVTGLNYPVVPKGEEEIRLQVSARHTEKDIDYLLATLESFRQ